MLKDRENGKGPIITETLADEETPLASLYFTDFHDLAFTTEKWIFSHLGPIAEIIGQSEINGRTRNFRFYDCPDQAIKSDIECSTNQINACFSPINCSLPQPPTRNSFSPLQPCNDAFVPGIYIAQIPDKLEHDTIDIPVACKWELENTREERLKVRFLFHAVSQGLTIRPHNAEQRASSFRNG